MRLLHRVPLTLWGAIVFAFLIAASGTGSSAQSARPPSSQADTTDAERCAALAAMDFGSVRDAPTRIASARVVDVPPADPKELPGSPVAVLAASPIKRYCQVLGYVAPQNRFELRLPLPSQWNQRFHLTACAGFCGAVNGNACNRTLARGYASVTGNGGHDGGPGFDGVWAANSPNLQEDFAWRHNHVITLAGKAITTTFYGRPIARSYMSGCSKGGHAVLMEAQRFPEDFDGLLPSAPVYDLVGRSMAGAAWWARAVSDGERGSILNRAVAETVHKSVLARCGAQAGVDEGLVTDPLSCDWKPEMVACSSGNADSGCLTPRQVEAITRMMSPAVNSKGDVLYAYPDIPGTATDWLGWHYFASAAPAAPPVSLNFISGPT